MWSATTDTLSYIWSHIEQLDIEYWKWVLWVIYPIIISFFLPLILLGFLYCSALFLHVYQYRHRLRTAYGQDFWDGAKKTVGAFWDGQARIWHGKLHILAWEFVTRSCLKPQNPCSNHEIHVLFEHGLYLKKPKLGPDLHA